MQQKTGNFQARQKNQIVQAINVAKTKRHKPTWTAAGPLKTTSGGRAYEIRNEFEWHTHRLDYNSDFSAWDMDVLVSTGILDVTQTRSYFAEPRLAYGDPEHVSRVTLVIHCLQLGYIAWFGLDVPLTDWTPIDWFQHLLQCQWFWPIKTGQWCNSLLLCRPDVAA